MARFQAAGLPARLGSSLVQFANGKFLQLCKCKARENLPLAGRA